MATSAQPPPAMVPSPALDDPDAALYVQLVAVGFSGPDFEVVADALLRYAYPILRAWLVSGQIVEECARKGVRGLRTLAARQMYLTAEDIEDLVQDTLIVGLRRFIAAGRAGTGWSSDGGAALRTYFLGGCVLAFGGVYETWAEKEQHRRATHTALAAQPVPHRSGDNGFDPVDILIIREKLRDVLPPPGRMCTAVLLDAAGYSHAEIARIIGEGTTPRAVEGLLYRYRKGQRGGDGS